MPARRRNRREKNKERQRRYPFVRYILLTALVVFLVVLFSFGGRVFKGDRKLVMVIPSNEAITISIFDPAINEITSVSVPATTEVDVSRNLGKWRIGSVWELGENEKLGGRLLAETVIKNFYAPATSWFSEKGLAYIEASPVNILSAIFSPGDTNLNFMDRVHLALFSLKVKEFKKTSLDLTETTFLAATKLRDGQEGYTVSKSIPQRLLVLFSDDFLVKGGGKAFITNSTGNPYFAKDLGKIIEVIGAKVVSVSNESEGDYDCVVVSSDKNIVQTIVTAFDCKYVKGGREGEIEIRIGEQFEKRF